MREQRGVGVEEAERNSAKLSTLAFRLGGSVGVTVRVGRASAFSTAEVSGPEGRLQEEAGDRLEEHPAGCPDEMHVHPLRDKDLPTQQELVVQCTRRQGHTGDPEPAADAGESPQVELLLHTSRDIVTGGGQVTGLFAVRRGQQRQKLVVNVLGRDGVLLEEPDGERRCLFAEALAQTRREGSVTYNTELFTVPILPPHVKSSVVEVRDAVGGDDSQTKSSISKPLSPR